MRRVPLPDGSEVEAHVVGFEPTVEPWSEYVLEDGTTVRIKTVVGEFLRLEGQYDQRGDPLYVVNSTNVVHVVAAEELRRPNEP
jgi:hypothetical protein